MEKEFFHWLWGDNILRNDEPNYLVNLQHGISVRFDYSESYFSSYEDFYENIADVQFLSGNRPSDEEIESLLIQAWNFLALSEREEDNRFEISDNF